MASGGEGGSPFDAERLLREYDLYDRNVDIVSAYEFMFTTATGTHLSETVTHFERYPRITHPDGKLATPDFTVLFEDNTALVAEIANLTLEDRGVDSLCQQLHRYDSLTEVPGPNGIMVPVSVVDVVYFVPMGDGTDAVRRIITDRLLNPEHGYKPSRLPILVQFARSSERYEFQVWPDDRVRGEFHRGQRKHTYSDLNGDLKIKPSHFAPIKVQRAFVNDPVSSLYLATVLWLKVLPTVFGAERKFAVTTESIKRALDVQYHHGTAGEVRRAMGLLVAADLADESGANTWNVRRRSLRTSETDLHRVIAERVSQPRGVRSPTRRPRRAKAQGSSTDQDKLPFDM